jgi:aminoglycoside phosphotransferase (APT) family kinase protein/RimJ/RimL family protein N-acetyltransferase
MNKKIIYSLVTGNKFSFRPLNLSDIPLICRWFNLPHVMKFYSLRKWTEDEVLKKLKPYISGEQSVSGFIVLMNEKPIGYAQQYKVSDYPWPNQNLPIEIVSRAASMDLFIGDESLFGKGIGQQIIQEFIENKIWPIFQYCIVDPDIRNNVAIKCYENLNFKEHAIINTQDTLGTPVALKLMIIKRHTIIQGLNITPVLASKLIANQFPEYANLPIRPVEKQGHDNRTFRLGENMLIRMPTAKAYALKVPKEQELLPRLKPYLPVAIPEPIKMGYPSSNYPFPFSIYKWLNGNSANNLKIDDRSLEAIALQLAEFLKELQSIDGVDGPAPGQHNWWRGDHVSVYADNAHKQIHELSGIINSDKAIALWRQACKTRWNRAPVWIHGDFASGNILIKNSKLSGIIDFGGMAVGDPACDLVIAWTFLNGKSREIFKESMELDSDTWLRAKAWALWKATYELCQMQNKNSHSAYIQKRIINEILE